MNTAGFSSFFFCGSLGQTWLLILYTGSFFVCNNYRSFFRPGFIVASCIRFSVQGCCVFLRQLLVLPPAPYTGLVQGWQTCGLPRHFIFTVLQFRARRNITQLYFVTFNIINFTRQRFRGWTLKMSSPAPSPGPLYAT